MSREFPELDRARIVVDPTTRERHLAAVRAALDERQRGPVRRRLLAVALVVVLAVPVMALAAADTMPGDLLYPIKRMTEPLVQLFDSDAPAERRVREAEAAFDRDSPAPVVMERIETARQTVTEDQPELSRRIERVAADLDSRRAGERPTDDATETRSGEAEGRPERDTPADPESEPTSTTTPERETTTTSRATETTDTDTRTDTTRSSDDDAGTDTTRPRDQDGR